MRVPKMVRTTVKALAKNRAVASAVDTADTIRSAFVSDREITRRVNEALAESDRTLKESKELDRQLDKTEQRARDLGLLDDDDDASFKEAMKSLKSIRRTVDEIAAEREADERTISKLLKEGDRLRKRYNKIINS